jgi:uncharacterized membrane-anchored protein YitT (DUF2179 family)
MALFGLSWKWKQKNMLKNKRWMNVLVIMAANFLLAFSSAFFLIPMNIVNGGMNGLSLIFFSWFAIPVDLTTAILAWSFFFIGLIILGKKFSAQTFLATILYPIFLFLLIRFVGPEWIGFSIDIDTHRLLASIFGGSLVGIGIGMSFLVGGSTGGFDVVMLIGQRYFDWKASVTSFLIDAIIIVIGMFTFGIISGLYGVISTVLTSVMIELVFVGLSKVYLVTIVSNKHQVINQFIIDKLSRGSTIYQAKGGYLKQTQDVIQVAIQRQEYYVLKQMVAETDPSAFVIITQARAILGLGFDPLSVALPTFNKKGKQA